jgi:hypothetical protein
MFVWILIFRRHFDASYWAMLKVYMSFEIMCGLQHCTSSSVSAVHALSLCRHLQLANPTWGVIGLNYREVGAWLLYIGFGCHK